MIFTREDLIFWKELHHYELEIDFCMREQGFLNENMTDEECIRNLILFEEVTKEFMDYIVKTALNKKLK